MSEHILPTPEEMIKYLDIYVRGQDKAKKALCSTIYFHYLKLATENQDFIKRNPYHILLVGPSGCGKTLMVKTIADYLKVPFCYCSAAGLVSAGYVGHNLRDILYGLTLKNGNQKGKNDRSILFIDEIDKIKVQECGHKDISGEAVQQELLSFLDGSEVTLNHDHGEYKGVFDTSKLLIIAAGAFVGIDEIIKKRLSSGKGLGFGIRKKSEDFSKINDVTGDDVIEFGLIPELVGRFQNITSLDELSVDMIKSIILDPNQTPLRLRRELYKMHNIDVEITDKAAEKISKIASRSSMGVRAISKFINNLFVDLDYRINQLTDDGYIKILVDENAIESRDKIYLIKEEQCVKPDDIDRFKNGLKYIEAMPTTQKWFDKFMNNCKYNYCLIDRFYKELVDRNATLQSFFATYIHSNTNNIQANLYYYDYYNSKDVYNYPNNYDEELLSNEIKDKFKFEKAKIEDKIIFEALVQFNYANKDILPFFDENSDQYNLTVPKLAMFSVLSNSLNSEAITKYISYFYSGRFNQESSFINQDFIDMLCSNEINCSPNNLSSISTESLAILIYKYVKAKFIESILSIESLSPLKTKYNAYHNEDGKLNINIIDFKCIPAIKYNPPTIKHPHVIIDFDEEVECWITAIKDYSFNYNKIFVLNLCSGFLSKYFLNENFDYKILTHTSDKINRELYNIDNEIFINNILSILTTYLTNENYEKFRNDIISSHNLSFDMIYKKIKDRL